MPRPAPVTSPVPIADAGAVGHPGLAPNALLSLAHAPDPYTLYLLTTEREARAERESRADRAERAAERAERAREREWAAERDKEDQRRSERIATMAAVVVSSFAVATGAAALAIFTRRH